MVLIVSSRNRECHKYQDTTINYCSQKKKKKETTIKTTKTEEKVFTSLVYLPRISNENLNHDEREKW